MPSEKIDRNRVVALLNEILAHELTGVVRYTHYMFMITGLSRIPIAKWAEENADESLRHARLAGEHITRIGGHPITQAGGFADTGKHDVESMLREAAAHEAAAVDAYTRLLELVEDREVALEEFARSQVAAETQDLYEIERMLRPMGRPAQAAGGNSGAGSGASGTRRKLAKTSRS